MRRLRHDEDKKTTTQPSPMQSNEQKEEERKPDLSHRDYHRESHHTWKTSMQILEGEGNAGEKYKNILSSGFGAVFTVIVSTVSPRTESGTGLARRFHQKRLEPFAPPKLGVLKWQTRPATQAVCIW